MLRWNYSAVILFQSIHFFSKEYVCSSRLCYSLELFSWLSKCSNSTTLCFLSNIAQLLHSEVHSFSFLLNFSLKRALWLKLPICCFWLIMGTCILIKIIVVLSTMQDVYVWGLTENTRNALQSSFVGLAFELVCFT